MLSGCYTALMTPFTDKDLDREGLEALLDFQFQEGITGILAVGTTGESPTLSWKEHNEVVEITAGKCKDKSFCIAGTGSNNTEETLAGTRHAVEAGAQAVLLVDPYYNGPSSLEIRREYVAPVAAAFPDTTVIPYVIPGRTGAQLLPQDIAILKNRYPNVSAVKEATGDLENMRLTRKLAGDDFTILSGDDNMTFDMIQDPAIRAAGVISVMSNIAPGAVCQMVAAALEGKTEEAGELARALKPLFDCVVVITQEDSPFGKVKCRSRNPVPAKTMMAILGMPGGACRRPLGLMTPAGLAVVTDALKTVWQKNPEILEPAAKFFNLDIEARLNDPATAKKLAYETYE